VNPALGFGSGLFARAESLNPRAFIESIVIG
jgi:hypothetical protein